MDAQVTASLPAGARADSTLQVLMVGLGREILAIRTESVREIIDPVPLTVVPGARSFLPALINVRGNVIPLADVALRLGLPRGPETPDTRFVVVAVEVDGDPVTVGLIADKVFEVTEVESAQSMSTPRIGARWNPEFVQFMLRWGEEFVLVPDLELLLS
ncbi:MAG: chemotaxis protein CheW [Bosea sp.]|nr:chemotaxis protein CheW [Bosea sp. (in: a-proteobacteria)]